MTNYQIYLLDREGRTARPPRIMPLKDDAAALAEARKTLDDQTIEIWQGDRCVATLLQMQSAYNKPPRRSLIRDRPFAETTLSRQ